MYSLVLASLRYYRRTNLAVAAGVATAVAVLAGALLVGASVRASLRDLAVARLGRTSTFVSGAHFFRQELAGQTGGCPLITLEGVVTNPVTGRRIGGVPVYGVDERFWRFHGWADPGAVSATSGLLDQVGAGELLVRLEQPAAIPKESLHGRKDEGKTMRFRPALTAREFSLRPGQQAVKAIFLPLRRLQSELGLVGRVNTILFDGEPPATLWAQITLDDFGIRVRPVAGGEISVESDAAIISDALAGAVAEAAGTARPAFSYLANTIRANGREIPYSLVTAVHAAVLPVSGNGILLNEWAARDLDARPGDAATLEFYLWSEGGNLVTRAETFRVERVLPMRGPAADRDFAPQYPGITEARSLHDWDPPFPMDLARIRPRDEDYWNRHRTTPKAFIAIQTGQRLWGSRFGRMTSLRLPGGDVEPVKAAIRARIVPERFGLSSYPVRADAIEAARGTTDFGQYFTYFSFFLVVSAALLAALFFRLGVEQRYRETGTLRAVGWPLSHVRRLLLAEGAILALAGAVAGMAGAVAYCALVLYGLRTWWRGAVGTTALELHVDAGSLLTGAGAGALIAFGVIWLSVRALKRTSPRALLAGERPGAGIKPTAPWVRLAAVLAAAAALGISTAGFLGFLAASAAFFGAGTLLLASAFTALSVWLRSPRHRLLAIERSPELWNLGVRYAGYRPGRSLLAIALIASAVFLVVALDAFRQTGGEETGPHSGTGGFSLLAESQLPVVWNPNSAEGRENLNLAPVAGQLSGVTLVPFRLRPGEDASCLNLYAPRNPRVLGAGDDFIGMARFRFASSLARAPEEKANPWRLLHGDAAGGVPAIADANSLAYVLHLKPGDTVVVGGQRLRIVGALAGSVLQGELIVSERNFTRMFPEVQGYRFFLIQGPPTAAGTLEDALSDFGFDAAPATERLAGFHRVENTYLSTFQALGALGLLLGTLGLAAVLLRNVLERRRELALMTALGYHENQLSRVVLAENGFLAGAGLLVGAFCAVVAIAPAAVERGAAAPFGAIGALLAAVAATALVSSLAAVRVARRGRLIEALRAE